MIARACAVVLLLGIATAHAQRANENVSMSHVYSAFVTGTDAGVMSANVVLGPELQQRLGLPAQADGAKAYEALMNLVGSNTKGVRRATPQEISDYGARRGFDAARNPVYALDAGSVQLLVQYDPQATRISYVGQLGVANPDPPPAAAPAPQVTPKDVLQVLATPPRLPPPAPVSVSFNSNSAKLTPQARDVLGEFLPKVADRRLQVSGHADAMGSPEYNQRLSKRRAEAVRAYLIGSGVAGDKIEVSAQGSAQPVKACPEQMRKSARRACLAPNRRVVIEAL